MEQNQKGVGVVDLPDTHSFGLSVRSVGLWALVVVFAGRGFATYLPTPLAQAVEPFRTLDRRFYAPLCLSLGIGYLLIALVGQA